MLGPVSRSITLFLVAALVAIAPTTAVAADWTVIAWNDLGMHCMDSDYAVFAILPPYNTIHAQLIDAHGDLVTNPGTIVLTYEAIADPDGSRTSSSIGRTDFWDHVATLFGVELAPDEGLAGFDMPGAGNQPQAMAWQPEMQWFTAEGIPLTPTDDAGHRNSYPMMRIVARDGSGQMVAATRVVLPVSDEMDCRSCHGSGSSGAAEPAAGWVWDADPDRDYRRNVLRLHDDRHASSLGFGAAAQAVGYSADGLEATVTSGTPILCAACHGSNALPGTGLSGIPQLTRSIHSRHATVLDPATGTALGAATNRTACYRCHPGSETRCLRGAMGRAVGAHGESAMQCQSCHGDMAAVGAAGRQGWLDQPTCGSCHTGTATRNSGQIRFTSALTADGSPRTAADATFATEPNTPAAGLSLYRFSTGHGGLQCEACHGSTHAVFPSSHTNDNLQSRDLQGHEGTLVECTACHASTPSTTSGGPHGMHPVGNDWAHRHGDAVEGNSSALAGCRRCHGADDRGTVLSRSHADRTLQTELGTINLWRGFQIGCYTCHRGPNSEDRNSNRPPAVTNTTASANGGETITIPLTASDGNGDQLTLRVVSQPDHGVAWIEGRSARYRAPADFNGSDHFTFAAWDGMIDSNLGSVAISVAAASCNLVCDATVPGAAAVSTEVPFRATATATGCGSAPVFDWTFGDGATDSGADVSHSYSSSGSYGWRLDVAAGDASCSQTGSVVVSGSAIPGWHAMLVATHADGAEGSRWRTDVVLLNPGSHDAQIHLDYRSPSANASATVGLAAGRSIRYADIVQSVFSLSGSNSGSVEISSSEPLAVSSRTFNASPAGAYGQFFPAVGEAAVLTRGGVAVVPHLVRNAATRSNLGFLNPGTVATVVRIEIHSADGNPVGTVVRRSVPASGWLQVDDILGTAGAGDRDLAWARITVEAGSGVWAYASVVDRGSGDPITVPMIIVNP